MQPSPTALRDTFDRVYRTNRWSARGNGSGPGSDLGPTAPLVRGLRAFIRERHITSICDVSCGGMAWWPHVLTPDMPDIRFFGFDVSAQIIARNVARFAHRTRWCFAPADARNAEFPEADLVVCRQTLNHLHGADATAVLGNIRRGVRFIAATHDPALPVNPADEDRRPLFRDDAAALCYARLNLVCRPFALAPYVASIDDVDDQVLGIFGGERSAG